VAYTETEPVNAVNTTNAADVRVHLSSIMVEVAWATARTKPGPAPGYGG
jgi:hypothetical protein